jgi:hypothetical protein
MFRAFLLYSLISLSALKVIPMIQITLPDASKREYPQAVTVAEVAASIGAGLAKAALAGKVDGKVVDTSYLITATARCPSSRPRTPTAWT